MPCFVSSTTKASRLYFDVIMGHISFATMYVSIFYLHIVQLQHISVHDVSLEDWVILFVPPSRTGFSRLYLAHTYLRRGI